MCWNMRCVWFYVLLHFCDTSEAAKPKTLGRISPHLTAKNEVIITRKDEVRNEVVRDKTWQAMLETVLMERSIALVWSRATHGRLHKSKTGASLVPVEKRNRGRPRIAWRDTVWRDIEPMWWSLSQGDGQRWVENGLPDVLVSGRTKISKVRGQQLYYYYYVL